MRVAVLDEDHHFRVESVDDPTPGPDELVLRVRACGICGSDLKAHTRMPVGAVLGHEFCGEVVAVGSGASDRWSEGRFVASMPLGSCGRCRWCLAGEPAHCERVDILGVGGQAGAFAELVRVDASATVAVPEAVGDLAALVEPLAVGLHTVVTADIGPGARVLVIGGGSVGSAVALWARRAGAGAVVVSDPVARRRDDAGRFGATDVHDPADGPAPADFDVVVECVGLPGMIQVALDAVRVRGRVVVAGVCAAPDQILPLGALMKEAEIRFAVFYRRDEFFAAASLLGSGALDGSPFVTSRVGLAGVDDAFARLTSGATDERKVLVVPGA